MCHFDRSDAKHREVEKFIFKTDFSIRLDWASELILHYHYPDFNPVVCIAMWGAIFRTNCLQTTIH